jgi:hypothetical protein
MIGFAESILTWLASTLLPAFGGLLIITWASKKIPTRYIVAFAFGIFFWFFVDTISGSAVLDVNSGFGGGIAQVGVVVLFLIGVLFFFWVDRKRDILSPQSAIGKYGLTIPVLVATALGIHGLGEGAAFGATAYSTLSTTLIGAFGGLTVGVAYVLHKGLEPMMIGACYSVYSKPEGGKVGGWLRNVFLLGIVFVIPSLLGAATGYLLASYTTYLLAFGIAYDTTYFFALGTGTAIYVVFRLAGPLFIPSGVTTTREPIKVAVSWILGIMAIYIAALFHS